MGRLLTIMLAAAMLPALGQAQTTDICGRTAAVRDAILTAVSHSNCATVPNASLSGLSGNLVLYNQGLTALANGDFAGLTSLQLLGLSGNQLAELPEGLFDGLTSLQSLGLEANQLAELPEGLFDGLTSLQYLTLGSNQLAELPEGLFDGLTSLQGLFLEGNQLAALPEGLFTGLTSLQELYLNNNQLAELPEGLFAGLTSLQTLWLGFNQLATLPEGLFAGLTSLQYLGLQVNQLAELPEGVFAGLTSLQTLYLTHNQLAELPEGLFAGLTSLQSLLLQVNQLAELPEGVFDGLTSLQTLWLHRNQLAELPEGLFAGLTSLQRLGLDKNQLAELPEGVFDGLTSLQTLYLNDNHLVGLTEDDPLFAGLPSGVEFYLGGQTAAPGQTKRLAAAVPLMISASDSMRQGFVRIINESDESGSVRVLAFDDGGTAAEPIEIQLGANQALHFNSGDLENGNANKGIATGIGLPVQGDWRLDIESALNVRIIAFVRTGDGFLTAMNETLPRDGQGRLAAHTFNPGSNDQSVSSLRLANAGDGAEGVSIQGVDDQGNTAGPVTLTLAAGEARTLSALDLETGNAQGLAGTLGDGAGKWRLFITAGQSVVGASLLEAATGHVTNLSIEGVSATAAAVPLMISASDSMRQGFVRIINEFDESGSVRVLAFDDGGNAAEPIEIQLGANQALHFNSGDLENGNANKGIATGIGLPVQGDWRLDIESALNVRIIAFVRTGDGFLTAMNETLPRDGQGRLVAHTFNPGSNAQSVSSLRLVNAGDGAESVSIEGVDDRGNAAGPVTLTLAAGESRTLSALDLEDGAQGLTGTLGDGGGKWRLFITAGQSVVGASLLRAATGHVTNLSIEGVSTAD